MASSTTVFFAVLVGFLAATTAAPQTAGPWVSRPIVIPGFPFPAGFPFPTSYPLPAGFPYSAAVYENLLPSIITQFNQVLASTADSLAATAAAVAAYSPLAAYAATPYYVLREDVIA